MSEYTKETPKVTGWYWLKFDPEYWPGLSEEILKPLMVDVFKRGDQWRFSDHVNHEEYPCHNEGRLWKGPLSDEDRPVDLLLFCPHCGEQHVDEAKPGVCETCGKNESDCACASGFTAWLNPPHKSHRCTSCNHVWRPADVPTNGVAKLNTSGQRDGSPIPRIRKDAP